MERPLTSILIIICALFMHSCHAPGEMHTPLFPYELLDTDPEEAYAQALDLRARSESDDHLPGLVESSFILGYIQYEKGKYNEAISHYLEAIHYAEQDSRSFTNKLILLYKNCGIIYRKTGSHRLAKESYQKGIRLAESSGNTKEVVSLSYNLSFIFKEQGAHERGIAVLIDALALAETGSKRYFQIHNDLAVRYLESGKHELAISTLNRLLDELPTDELKKRSSACHNMARTYKSLGELDLALNWYQKAIAEKKKSGPDNPALFSSLYGMGETYSLMGDLEKAKKYFSEAEPFITDETRTNPAYFELYKAQAELFHRLGDMEKAFQYQAHYSSCRDEREAIREQYAEEMKSYNMELLTEQVMGNIEAKEAAKERQRNSQQWMIIGWATLSGLLGMALVVMIIYYRRKLKATKSELKTANKIGFKLIDEMWEYEQEQKRGNEVSVSEFRVSTKDNE